MKNNLSDERSIYIMVDENKNIAVFPMSINPQYVPGVEGKPPHIQSEKALELFSPYSYKEVVEIIMNGIEAWEKYEPFLGKGSLEELYYNTKGFKAATLGKRLINLGWNDIEGKYVSLSLPSKRGKYYMCMEIFKLHEEADWDDFAKIVLDFINKDLKEFSTFKTYKRLLNV